jgi:hypothetical protein
MAKKTIPKNPGRFRVITAMGSNYLVINDRTGKSQVTIPCRSKKQAEEIRGRLNAGDHHGEIIVPDRVR